MRSRWEALHSGLTLSIRSEKSARAFTRLKANYPNRLGPFTDSAVLLAKLHESGGDATSLDQKDRILGALVRGAALPCTSDLAIELLLLGLWPGLSALFTRLVHLFQQRPNELAAEILARFTECARRLDLARCTRVAATLVLNTERVIKSARMLELKRAAANTFLGAESESLADPAAERATALVDLRAWLGRAVPNDVDLIFSIVIGGKNCREAAAALGISHANARQRLARALARIRLLVSDSGVTDRGVEPAFVGR